MHLMVAKTANDAHWGGTTTLGSSGVVLLATPDGIGDGCPTRFLFLKNIYIYIFEFFKKK
jgi:hypothetical protein